MILWVLILGFNGVFSVYTGFSYGCIFQGSTLLGLYWGFIGALGVLGLRLGALEI